MDMQRLDSLEEIYMIKIILRTLFLIWKR